MQAKSQNVVKVSQALLVALCLTACGRPEPTTSDDAGSSFSAIAKRCVDKNPIDRTIKTVTKSPTTGNWIASFQLVKSIRHDATKTESIVTPYRGSIEIEYLEAEYSFPSQADAAAYNYRMHDGAQDVRQRAFKLFFEFSERKWKIDNVRSILPDKRTSLYSNDREFMEQFPSGKECLPL